MIDSQQTVAAVVLDHSECAAVFQQHRIDFCCKGDLSLEAAALGRKVELKVLLAELEAAIAQRQGNPAADPRALSTPGLVSHLVTKHHESLRRTLPFVQALATKVGRVHGEHNPRLRDLDRAVRQLAGALLAPLEAEERRLFPSLTAHVIDREEVARQFAQMTEEHLAITKVVEQIRVSSDEFSLPDWACNSYRTLFSELGQLEKDVFTHVHLENHVLKPRFAAGAA